METNGKLRIEALAEAFTVCKVADYGAVDWSRRFCFACKTDAENSLVCETACVPANVRVREDGWRGFRIVGTLDFALVGILSRIAAALAEARIGIFAVSTFDTDYVFVKAVDFDRALAVLAQNGIAEA